MTDSRWDGMRARRKGVDVSERRRPAATEVIRCGRCGAESRQLVGQGPGWLQRHSTRRHPDAGAEALF